MKLRLQGPENQTREVHLTATPLSVGRGMENDIVLCDRTISRQHCLFTINEEGMAVVEDVDSRYGTLVNSERIMEPVVLNPGDSLVVGGWKGMVYDDTLEGEAAGDVTALAIPQTTGEEQVSTKETRLLRKRPQVRRSAGYTALLVLLAVIAALLLAFVLLDPDVMP